MSNNVYAAVPVNVYASHKACTHPNTAQFRRLCREKCGLLHSDRKIPKSPDALIFKGAGDPLDDWEITKQAAKAEVEMLRFSEAL